MPAVMVTQFFYSNCPLLLNYLFCVLNYHISKYVLDNKCISAPG